VQSNAIAAKASIPLWVMMIGAAGIAMGLALYGPRLIRTVGSEITELDQVRAYSIAMAAAITVIIASQLGLPVSSTHIAIGGVFGVGFLRELLHNSKEERLIRQERALSTAETETLASLMQERDTIEALPEKGEEAYARLSTLNTLIEAEKAQIAEEHRRLEAAERVRYVKRSHIRRIIAAWIITVPVAGMLSAILYFVIRGIAA
jgi:PiT family inorganic phosphate transporter